VIIFASFDGIILNFPFFGVMNITPDDGIELSLIVRIFIASIPILPLMIHFSNTKYFDKICNVYSINIKFIFNIIILIFGLISGLLFIRIYEYTNGIVISMSTYFYFLIILLSFSYYISELRFSFSAKDFTIDIAIALGINLVFFIIAICSINLSNAFVIPTVVILQSISLIIGAMLLNKNYKLYIFKRK
jgi:hypothetical protein